MTTEKQSPIAERRRYIRTDRCIPLVVFIDEENVSKPMKTETRNISATGVMVEGKEKLPLGIELKLDIEVPNATNSVHGKGRVIWSSQAPESQFFSSGIEFTKIEEDNKNTFLKFLCDAIYKAGSNE